jgi:small-conductance mechanosensitive channel
LPSRAVQLIVLVATLWAASVAGVVAQPQRPFGTILAEWSRTIDQASQELGRGEIAPERSARLIERLDQIGDEAAQIQDNARDQLDPLYGQLRALGVVPSEGEAPEPAAIATQRSQLQDTIATFEARVRQTELTITRAQELEDRLKSAVREQALERLLKDFPSPYIPANFLKALPEFLQQLALVAASPLLWWQEFGLDNRQKGHLYGTGLILVLTFLIGWLLRYYLLKWCGHDPANSEPTYARRLLAAIAVGLARGIVPALIFGAILYRFTSESTLVHGLFADVVVALVGVLIFFVLAWALPHAVLAPDLPAWRLTPLSAKNSRKIAHGVAMLAGVYAIDLFIRLATKSLVSSEALTSSYAFVSNTIEAALILALLRGKLWQGEPVAGAPGEAPAEDAPQLKRRHIWTAIRLAIGLTAVAAVALAVAGYANLSDFLINRMMASGAIVGVLFLFRGLVRETIGVWLRSDFMRSMLDVRYSARNVLKFWLRGALDVLVFSAGLFLLLSAWGVPVADMVFWIERALTGLTIGNVTLSIADILVAIAIFVIALVATRMLQRVLRDKVLPQTRLDIGVRHSLSAGVWYLGLIIASVLAISAMGLELSNLAIVAGALHRLGAGDLGHGPGAVQPGDRRRRALGRYRLRPAERGQQLRLGLHPLDRAALQGRRLDRRRDQPGLRQEDPAPLHRDRDLPARLGDHSQRRPAVERPGQLDPQGPLRPGRHTDRRGLRLGRALGDGDSRALPEGQQRHPQLADPPGAVPRLRRKLAGFRGPRLHRQHRDHLPGPERPPGGHRPGVSGRQDRDSLPSEGCAPQRGGRAAVGREERRGDVRASRPYRPTT